MALSVAGAITSTFATKMKILIGSVILIGICLLACLAVPTSKEIIAIADFSCTAEASVQALIRPFATGAMYVVYVMYVMYEGNLDSDAIIEVRSNHGHDAHNIELTSGSVQGVYGGAEMWVDDLSIRFVSSAATSGDLRIGLYCEASFLDADRKWHRQLSRQ